jgi:hypothetical protein
LITKNNKRIIPIEGENVEGDDWINFLINIINSNDVYTKTQAIIALIFTNF